MLTVSHPRRAVCKGCESYTHLALEIKRSRVRIRPLRPQRVCELLGRKQHLILSVRTLALALADDRLVEVLGRVEHRCNARRVVVDARVYHDGAVPRVRLGWRLEVVHTPCLDVHGRNFGAVVRSEDGELDSAAPCGRFEDCLDVVFPRATEWNTEKDVEVSPAVLDRTWSNLDVPQNSLVPLHGILPDSVRHN